MRASASIRAARPTIVLRCEVADRDACKCAGAGASVGPDFVIAGRVVSIRGDARAASWRGLEPGPVAAAIVESCRTGDSPAVRAWLSCALGPVLQDRVSAGRRLAASRCAVPAIQDCEGCSQAPTGDNGEEGPGSDARVAPVDAAGRGWRGLLQLDNGHLRSAEGTAAFDAAGVGRSQVLPCVAWLDGSAASRVLGCARSCCATAVERGARAAREPKCRAGVGRWTPSWPDGGCSRRRAGGTVGNRPRNGLSASWPTGGG
jgi:hypothetical protein